MALGAKDCPLKLPPDVSSKIPLQMPHLPVFPIDFTIEIRSKLEKIFLAAAGINFHNISYDKAASLLTTSCVRGCPRDIIITWIVDDDLETIGGKG